MPPVNVDPEEALQFATDDAFDAWLAKGKPVVWVDPQ